MKKELDNFHLHEATDRCFIAADFVSRNLVEHDLIASVPELAAQADQVVSILNDLYQRLGAFTDIDEVTRSLAE